MEHVQFQIPIDMNFSDWTNRCNERLEKLKEIQFPDEHDQSLHPMLLLEKDSTEGKFVSYELLDAVENGNADDFVNILEQLSLKEKLTLSTIFDQVTPRGDSLLHLAAYFGSDKIAELIVQHFPKLLLKANVKGDTALHTAARAKNANVVKIILAQYDAQKIKSSTERHEVLTRMKSMCGNTALHEAVESDDFDVLASLYYADECVSHFPNKFGTSPLYLAVLASNNRILNLLLQAPFQKEEPLPRSRGCSPLRAAIFRKTPALVEEILQKRLELMYLKDEKGGAPLHFAASIGYLEGVQILSRKCKSNMLAWNTKGDLPIHVACKKGHVELVKEFLRLERFTSPYLVNKKGQNILHVAAKKGKNNVVEYILSEKKIALNEQDNNGNTPLHLASKNLYPQVLISLTRDNRIDPHLRNNEGLTALDFVVIGRKSPFLFREYLSLLILHSANAPRSLRKGLNEFNEPPKVDLIKDQINTLMIVAILIATVTFGAGFTLPGSLYSSDDPAPNKRGTAILVHKLMFQVFTVCNAVAMYSSIVGSFVLFWASIGDYYLAINTGVVALHMVGLALVTTATAFMAAVHLVVSNVSWLGIVITIIGSIFLSIILLCYILLIFPYGVRHPILRPVANFLMKIFLIPFGGTHVKVKAKQPKESNTQQIDKGKQVMIK